jgi:hypothetical protein
VILAVYGWIELDVGHAICCNILNAKNSPSLRVFNQNWAELLVQADLENFTTMAVSLPNIKILTFSFSEFKAIFFTPLANSTISSA